MQCHRCSGLRSFRVPNAWWQAVLPCTVRYRCGLCGDRYLRLSAPALLRKLSDRLAQVVHVVCGS